ncbi:hypothetical protein EYZ11_003326 [Aspergillus tanneri]|uniref:Uncharacterized protein n=1 Tax=Aspergillus tanneri TaxID=1220188 RepID=A0A4S3JQS2_9EURO|nr:hypothetical protein EYZ11_003326 [Aspergillus tanneri]
MHKYWRLNVSQRVGSDDYIVVGDLDDLEVLDNLMTMTEAYIKENQKAIREYTDKFATKAI